MDWGTTVITVISILIIVIPVAIMYSNKAKREKRMLHALQEMAQQHHCTIHQHEFCGDFVIGLDENKDFVFFFKLRKDQAIAQFVDLSEVQSCQAVKKARNVNTTTLFEQVDLGFLPANKNKAETRFELYDEAFNTQLSGELQFADKWAKQLNDRLKSKK